MKDDWDTVLYDSDRPPLRGLVVHWIHIYGTASPDDKVLQDGVLLHPVRKLVPGREGWPIRRKRLVQDYRCIKYVLMQDKFYTHRYGALVEYEA